MSYKFGFADNETYNAADVNKITSRLVTSGVSDPFENGEPFLRRTYIFCQRDAAALPQVQLFMDMLKKKR